MAALLGMKPKHHEDMKLGKKRTAKKATGKSDEKRKKGT